MGLFSCSDDNETVDNLLPPTIVKVCVWDEDIEEWIIPGAESKIRIGTPLRIEGTNMAQTITYDHAYGQYGWKNTKNVDLSVYNHIVLEIEATDSRVEIYVLYEGLEKSTCIGGIDAGKTKAVCELEHIDKVQAIYIAKSKVGITKIVKFVLTDEID